MKWISWLIVFIIIIFFVPYKCNKFLLYYMPWFPKIVYNKSQIIAIVTLHIRIAFFFRGLGILVLSKAEIYLLFQKTGTKMTDIKALNMHSLRISRIFHFRNIQLENYFECVMFQVKNCKITSTTIDRSIDWFVSK